MRRSLRSTTATRRGNMGASIHPRLKQPVGQRLALGALKAAYGVGGGATGGVVAGCALSADHGALTLSFETHGRALSVRAYNASNAALSATAVLFNTSAGPRWVAVPLALGASSAACAHPGACVTLDLAGPGAPRGATPVAVRYAWGSTGTGIGSDGAGGKPNGDDVSCCEGDGVAAPCVPAQCPLLVKEEAAPFGVLPVEPFVAEIVGGKCVCPEPQTCSA